MARTRLDEAAHLTVADVTHSQFKALSAGATVGEVQEWFQHSTSRQMALLADDGRYAGRLLRGDLDGVDASDSAADFAERGVTVAPGEPASRGEEIALATPGLRVPVVDADGRLVGIVAVTTDRQGFCGTQPVRVTYEPEQTRVRGVLVVMAAHSGDIAQPLTLSEQLDAMLLGWLEHTADRRGPAPAGLRATAVMTIAAGALPEIQRLCERWHMPVVTQGAVVLVSGPARVVDGLVAVTGMYRR